MKRKAAINLEKRLENGIQYTTEFAKAVNTQVQNQSSTINGLNECSKLFSMGYTTMKNAEERRAILDSFIAADGAEKAKRYLNFLINTRSNMKNGIYANSVSKWTEDLNYINNK